MGTAELVVKDGRVSVPALAIGLINRIGRSKAQKLAEELMADIKTPPSKAAGTSRASAGAKRTLSDITAVKGTAPQKGQLPAGLVKWLKSRQTQKAAMTSRRRGTPRKRQVA